VSLMEYARRSIVIAPVRLAGASGRVGASANRCGLSDDKAEIRLEIQRA
jgi:hypothetical protein